MDLFLQIFTYLGNLMAQQLSNSDFFLHLPTKSPLSNNMTSTPSSSSSIKCEIQEQHGLTALAFAAIFLKSDLGSDMLSRFITISNSKDKNSIRSAEVSTYFKWYI